MTEKVFTTVRILSAEYRNRILGRNLDKSLKSFPPCYSQSPLQLCLRFPFLHIHATSYSFWKGERRKPDRKPYPLPYGLRNPNRNLKHENSQDYAQKTQAWLYMFMNSASVWFITWKYAEYGEAGVWCPAADLGESRYELHRGGGDCRPYIYHTNPKELTDKERKAWCRL